MFRKNSSLIVLALVALVGVSTLFQGCKDKHIEERTFVANVPVYKSYAEMRTEVKMEAARPLEKPGKIFVHGQHILVNEKHKGIHIINNQDPANPTKVAFLNIPGNVDIAIKGNKLYADSYTDLVTFEINDPTNITMTSRIRDVFQYSVPDYDASYPLARVDEDKGVIVEWEVKQITERCVNEECGAFRFADANGVLTSEQQATGGFVGGGNNGNGNIRNAQVSMSGSMARFLVKDNCLYTVSSTSEITVFDIAGGEAVSSQTLNVGWSLETLFPYEDYMFVGSRFGMYIYDISSCSPEYVSEFQHTESCDPVIVYEDYAYVTLTSGSACGGWQDQLDIIDVSTITNPQLRNSYNMTEPQGIGIDGSKNLLFLCDGRDGLKVFDITNPETCGSNEVQSFPGIDAYDVIPMNNTLMLIGDDGLHQYNYSDVNNISLLSTIPIGE